MRFDILPVVLYLIAASMQWCGWKGYIPVARYKAILLIEGFVATALHAYLLYYWIDIGVGQNLAFFNMLSLVAWLVALLILFTSLRSPVENLTVFIFPVAAASIVLVNVFPGYYVVDTAADTKVLLHILLSTLAFSMLCVAGLQALLLAIQEWRLRRRHGGRIIEILPPLETMEMLLFRMVGIGFLLLSMVLITSIYFFSQHEFTPVVVRKSMFAMLAWLVFGGLLIGRWRYGWRGKYVVCCTLGGVLLLIITYFSGAGS